MSRNKKYGKRHCEKKKTNKTAKVRLWFKKYKDGLICASCGENHPSCLTFHHRNPREKDISVSLAVRRGWDFEMIQKEISKCDVLCLNCHSKIHWDENHTEDEREF